MSNSDEGIELNKKNLIKNYNSLFDNDGNLKNNNDDNMSIKQRKFFFKERILLLNTILRDEIGLKRLLENVPLNKSYNFLFYLLNKIKNEKLKKIITERQKNTGKKNLLEGIVLKAKELIKSIEKKERESKREKEENEKKTNIDMWKNYILEYINKNKDYVNRKEKLSGDADYKEIKKKLDDDQKYSVLIKNVENYEADPQDMFYKSSKTVYYLLYKERNIFTMKTIKGGIVGEKATSPIILDKDNDIESYYFTLLSELFKDLQKLQQGGKPTTTPVYKLNGEKVSLLINKTKLHRSVYVKGNGNRKVKYCKINNEFVLLSKLKNKIIEI